MGHVLLQGDGLLSGLSGQLDSGPAFGREQHSLASILGRDEIAQAAQPQTEQEQRADDTLGRVGGQVNLHSFYGEGTPRFIGVGNRPVSGLPLVWLARTNTVQLFYQNKMHKAHCL